MIGAFYSDRGPAREVLHVDELPTPQPAAGEVLVRVHASGANPSDVKTRAGNMGPMTVARTVPHSDGAGVIEAVGDGISPRRIGERVWLYNVNRTADGQGQGDRAPRPSTRRSTPRSPCRWPTGSASRRAPALACRR